ncbi:MAG TPA: phosphatase PAP2 family protein [Pseudolysinimonas sp.]|jgi:undecaprenyl-diphosphatase|nr:phosphatase family protein [Schumannella sp.]HEV7743134.1 phosphatase PAP2 family protein [Pseudolysinimonas sp.]
MSTQERVERSPYRRAAIAAGVALLLAVGLGVLVTVRVSNPESIDSEWMDEIVAHRSPWWEVPARVFDFIGGGWFGVLVVPVGIAVALLIARRPWAASAFILGSAVSSGVVQVMKIGFGRARPEQILIPLDSPSFPSGHTANAATIVVLLALLLRRRWIAVAGAGYVVLMALSRTYLGAHWVTDTLGGILVGSALAVLVWVIFARRLAAESGVESTHGLSQPGR